MFAEINYFSSIFAHSTTMVDKICRAVYAYEPQTGDELTLAEGEEITVVAAADADWVTGQNSQGDLIVDMKKSLAA